MAKRKKRQPKLAPPSRPVRPGLVSPTRQVPPTIARPPYAQGGGQDLEGEPVIKTPDVIERMRRAGKAARRVLKAVAAEVRPGVTTDHLDEVCHEACIAEGGYPSPLGYNGFPKSLCTSINEVICHGIPDSRKLVEGDIVNCDVTIYLDGVHGDHSETFCVGEVDPTSAKLVRVTREALYAGIGQARAGNQIRDIGRAIQGYAEGAGFGVVREFIGHGVGETFHMAPSIPHYYDRNATTVLEAGMAFTIEPMITVGSWRAQLWDDGWTATTVDLQRTAQFEHTVLVNDDGTEILTLEADEPQPFLEVVDTTAGSGR